MDAGELHSLRCHAISVMQCMSAMTVHYMDVCESHILCYIEWLSSIFCWVRISIDKAGAITSNLSSSWAGAQADH